MVMPIRPMITQVGRNILLKQEEKAPAWELRASLCVVAWDCRAGCAVDDHPVSHRAGGKVIGERVQAGFCVLSGALWEISGIYRASVG